MRTSANADAKWLASTAPSLSTVAQLPDNTETNRNNTDCHTSTYVPFGSATPQTICTFGSRIGAITRDGNILTTLLGHQTLVSLHGPEYQSYFIPTNDPSVSLVALPSPGTGNAIGIYRALSRGALHFQTTINEGIYYEVTNAPTAIIRDPQTRQPLVFDINSVALSSNNEWLVASIPHRGLVEVKLSDLSAKLFAQPVEPPSFDGLTGVQLAVSNDGRYVAANTDVFGNGNITMYDTLTCTDQLHAATGGEQYCEHKDIWHGLSARAQQLDQGLLASRTDMVRPSNIRFIDDDNLRFDATYAAHSSQDYKTARYIATAPGGLRHKIGLLGFGDSYISGQGAFIYRAGTDTSNNFCHLSELSYPFLLGPSSFNSFNSIACSGAVTQNIMGLNPKYTGQVNDNVEEKDRDQQQILSNFMPGYIYQQEFASAYLPEAMIVSVGGDDIGFGDIVKKCVANSGGGTCYDTYEERAELLQTIDDIYDKLVRTYEMLQQQSGGGRLYVVGYPQVAKPDGNCGANVHLNSAELTFASQLISYLDSVVQQAATTAGAFYVDTQSAFDGHRLCEAGEKAMNGFTVGNDAGVTIKGKTINFIGSESYHPTAYGYELLARTIAASTKNLSAPMPTPAAYKRPAYSNQTPMLQGLSGAMPSQKASYDQSLAPPVVLAADQQEIAYDGDAAQIKPGSTYQLVLHSDPVVLASGSTDGEGRVQSNFAIPAGTEQGFHTLHLYATDVFGQRLDIQRIVYVARDMNDFDGNSKQEAHSQCVIVGASGLDADNDGVDDACDPDIKVATVATISGIIRTNVEIAKTQPQNTQSSSQQQPTKENTNQATSVDLVSEDQSINGTNLSTQPVQKVLPLRRIHWSLVFIGFVVLSVLCASFVYIRNHRA